MAAVVVASCGAGSVGGKVSKPLPYGWYSKRVSKKPLKEMRAAWGKKGASHKNVETARMHERWMLRYYDIVGKWPSKIHARRVRGIGTKLWTRVSRKYQNWVRGIGRNCGIGLEELARICGFG